LKPAAPFVTLEAPVDGLEAPVDRYVDEFSIQKRDQSLSATADDWIDAFRRHPEWSDGERDKHFENMVAQFSKVELLASAMARVKDLTGLDAEPIVRIVESLGASEHWTQFADAVARQRDLPVDRAWELLSVLDGLGLIESTPSLAERWHDLNEEFEQDDSVSELVHQLEHDSDGLWMALQGLESIEPEVRADIIASLVEERVAGPGLIEFLRLLAFAHDRETRESALAALERLPLDDPRVLAAWISIASDHDVAPVSLRAADRAGAIDRSVPVPQGPRCVRSLVTSLDGRGVGYVVLVARTDDDWVAAAFECDVTSGIREVTGVLSKDKATAEDFVAEFAADSERSVIEDAHELAKNLLAGGLLLCRPTASPALRFWIEGVAGRGFRPRPLAGLLPEPELRSATEDVARAAAILDACPGWVDDSDLTYELAEERLLRAPDSPADPVGDMGAIRFLFENRLRDRLELDRRMLCWMAAFWHAAGSQPLSHAAADMARQLADPAQAVPAQPFLASLATKSLQTALENLQRGVDLRQNRSSADTQ
jgi:hypothetical protein